MLRAVVPKRRKSQVGRMTVLVVRHKDIEPIKIEEGAVVE